MAFDRKWESIGQREFRKNGGVFFGRFAKSVYSAANVRYNALSLESGIHQRTAQHGNFW
jgi:hypothetical protein